MENIVDVVRGAGVVLKAGRTGAWKGLCPFCGEPNFYVHEPRQFFHCFGCGAKGRAKDFPKKDVG